MNILITAGPTREYLDDVRYLSNASTGRMGYALATAAVAAGHAVTLVTGPTSLPTPAGLIQVHRVESARQMLAAVEQEFAAADVLVACAAVSDYRVREQFAGKLKREKQETLLLELVRNPDIVHQMSERRQEGQTIIGFALEAADGEQNARDKLRRKGLDAIVLNAVSAIGAEQNDVVVYFADDQVPRRVMGPKGLVAEELISIARELHQSRRARS